MIISRRVKGKFRNSILVPESGWQNFRDKIDKCIKQSVSFQLEQRVTLMSLIFNCVPSGYKENGPYYVHLGHPKTQEGLQKKFEETLDYKYSKCHKKWEIFFSMSRNLQKLIHGQYVVGLEPFGTLKNVFRYFYSSILVLRVIKAVKMGYFA